MSGSYPVELILTRYALDNSGNRIEPGTVIIDVYTFPNQFFDMFVDNPGEGSFGYALSINCSPDLTVNVSSRRIVALVTKR